MTQPSSSVAFIAGMSDGSALFVAPDIGVTQGFKQPLFNSEGALASMADPQCAPVPSAITITERERSQLGQGARAFFRQVMRPTIKHV